MIKVGIAGLGTVGAGVARLLQDNAEIIAQRAGQPIIVEAVSARDKNRKRPCNLSGMTWVDDPLQLATMPNIDVVVELIGGADGVALGLAEKTLANGKAYVTANKALLAAHGVDLAKKAEAAKVALACEGSVAGGIPVLKALREGLAGNQFSIVRGILNGTCNYILTRMRAAQLSFADALREAQDYGYAEADPASDIDGHDTANKLVLLAALAFGIEPDLSAVRVEGIRRITSLDLQFAAELDCRIKLLGVAQRGAKGVAQRVGPCLVPTSSPLAEVDGVLNAVFLRGDFVGDVMLSGRGAGAEPTASAVVADIIDIARGHRLPAFGCPAGQLQKSGVAVLPPSRHYIRLQVMDKPGVVADISSVLRDAAISIESLIQRGRSITESVPVVMIVHEAPTATLHRAIEAIARVPTVVNKPCVLPIED
jgi:homoserine dehydrogenase